MKLVFSRKGYDSGSGGGPSPIVDGRPVSLPIPAKGANDVSRTRYRDIKGLGHLVTDGDALCHHDPFFKDGRCAFGQCSAAQRHLENQGVGPGDVFLFFGLFAGDGHRPHHRIFATMLVHHIIAVDAPGATPPDFAPDHPHFLNPGWPANRVYVGPASVAARASDALRLTAPDQPLVSLWRVPDWLHRGRCLSYHGADWRWARPGHLRTVGRGQEFVVDIGDDPAAHVWLEMIRREIEKR